MRSATKVLHESSTSVTLRCMSGTDFQKWLESNGLSVVDVAAALKMNPITFTRFIKGTRIHKNTAARLRDYMASYEASRSKAKAVS